ncbi:glutathione S-transferase [Chytriomyces sp. MP71]|nr:glutathione S-transferase [Chytriomyces sp. MP71]
MLQTWQTLRAKSAPAVPLDPVNGPPNAQAYLRLFGRTEADLRVTLYRDLFAWCPYCHKVWLFLEEKRIPYRVRKVTMFCYGEKEAWYKRIVPGGMLPALELDGTLITESDALLVALERAFGPLGPYRLTDTRAAPLRRLERAFFGAWCGWLCYPDDPTGRARKEFVRVLERMDAALGETPGDYFAGEFGVVDVIFAPFLERAHASLWYYKGFDLYAEEHGFARLRAWNTAMQGRETVQKIRADFFTHVHDLPPQLGGCVETGTPKQVAARKMVNRGPWRELPDWVSVMSENEAELRREAVYRVTKHHIPIEQVNPDKTTFDEALRAAMTNLLVGRDGVAFDRVKPPAGSAMGLRHLKNQISVPRDMSAGAANLLRQELEATAALDADAEPPALPTRHRRDQDSLPFQSKQ